jgi:hypothetical protein
MQICGFEVLVGTSKTTGKPYDMSRFHTLIPLDQSANAVGYSGTSYSCPAHVLDKLRDVTLPITCDVQMQDVQRYGKREQQVVSISPMEQQTRKAA